MVFCPGCPCTGGWKTCETKNIFSLFICLYNLQLSSLGNDLLLQLKSKVIRTLFLFEDLVILVVFKAVWKEWTRISGLAPQKCYLKRLPQCQIVIFFFLYPAFPKPFFKRLNALFDFIGDKDIENMSLPWLLMQEVINFLLFLVLKRKNLPWFTHSLLCAPLLLVLVLDWLVQFCLF